MPSTISSPSSTPFLKAVQDRRTYYALSKKSTISDAQLQEIINTAVKHAPSSFNSQSARVVVLLNQQHDKLWDITLEILQAKVSAEQFPATQTRINGFKNAHGTVLFFEDQNVVKSLQEKFASYKDKFPDWSSQSSGMLQYIVWTALEQEGLGASLQHYNPLIDEKVASEWKVPSNWRLVAQMPFGVPIVPPSSEKQFVPLEDRVLIFV